MIVSAGFLEEMVDLEGYENDISSEYTARREYM